MRERRSDPSLYDKDDFRLFSHVLGLLPAGGRVLEVGVSTGQFIDILASSGKFDEVVGVDTAKRSGFHTISTNYLLRIADCRDLPFDDKSFDSVVCLDVLDHLPAGDIARALSEIRRVCKNRLVISVAYTEKAVISVSRPLVFDDAMVARYFPDAATTVLTLQGRGVWALIIEDQ